VTEKRIASRIDWRREAERYALIGVWAVLIAGFGARMPSTFLSWNNIAVMLASYSPGALLALAIIIPITAGDFDLSVGANLTLTSCLIGVLNAQHHMPIGYVLAIGVAAGALVGAINAFFILVFRIPSLVVTLGVTSLLTGLEQWMTNSSTIGGVSPWLIDVVVGGRFLGLPYAFCYVLLGALSLWYVFDLTPLGRRLLFVGRGREVARLNGVAVERVRAGSLIAAGVISALAGAVYAGALGSADPTSGQNFLLPAFAAAYLGATTIAPGRFNPVGAVVAVYFLATGITGLAMMGVPLWVTNVFNGGALIVAVTVSQLTRGREAIEMS
jgi:ribose transport system permease protein